MLQENENGKLVFKWHFLVAYLLIAAIISYQLVDYKSNGESPSATEKTTFDEIRVTRWDDSDIGSNDDETIFIEPGTIQEFVPPAERTTENETSSGVSMTGGETTTKNTTTTTHSTTKPTTETTTSSTTEPTTIVPQPQDALQ